MKALKINAKDITAIVDNDLCHSCGACANVCHPKVISFEETTAGHLFPKINYDNCTACTLCSAVCPGVIFGKTMNHTMKNALDPFVGNIQSTFVGQSLDNILLTNSQSGGTASAIILNALENDLIDTAIVAIMDNKENISGDVILAYTKEDILMSQKSKYIPISLLTALDKIKEKKERFAIVGLACHIHGLHNILDNKPSLKKYFTFSVGLICDRVMVRAGMDFLIRKANVQKQDVKNFYFRDKVPYGYPGYVHIQTKNKNITLPPEERMQIKDFFTPARCRICFDKMNIGSDITIGDPHGIDNVDRTNGESLIIVRTATGKFFLENSLNIIKIKQTSIKKAINGQGIEAKKQSWRSYIEHWKDRNMYVPDYYFYLEKKTNFIKRKKEKIHLHNALSLRKYTNEEKIFEVLIKKQKQQRILKILKSPLRKLKSIFFYFQNR